MQSSFHCSVKNVYPKGNSSTVYRVPCFQASNPCHTLQWMLNKTELKDFELHDLFLPFDLVFKLFYMYRRGIQFAAISYSWCISKLGFSGLVLGSTSSMLRSWNACHQCNQNDWRHTRAKFGKEPISWSIFKRTSLQSSPFQTCSMFKLRIPQALDFSVSR